MKKSKDLRLIIVLLAFELLTLTVLSIIAIAKYSGTGSSGNGASGIGSRSAALAIDPDSAVLKVGGDIEPVTPAPNRPTAAADATATPAPEITPEPEQFNYYSFSFNADNYIITKQVAPEGGFSGEALVVDGIPDDKFTIPTKSSFINISGVGIENEYVNKPLPLREIFAEPLKLRRFTPEGSAQFLVFYTHTYEGYCLTEEEQLHEKRWYTSEDNASNVVAAGTALYDRLDLLGIRGVNNITVHNDGKDALKSYELSIVTLASELEANPDTKLVVDVHRNGYGKLYKGKLYGPTTELNDEKYAKLMFVIGLDYDSSKGEYSYENNPYWEENFKLVFLLIQKLEEKVPGICSGIALRKTPYNQGLAPNSLLVEVGFEGNLVSEAQRSAEVLAEVLAEVYS
ncbi:MAG: stage II sporulation protein P [Clostridia bacterium]|nr:stage II sporulation protein P [Clostridia bacterium]